MKSDDDWSRESMSPHDRIERYTRIYSYRADEDFEKTLVYYRQQSMLEYLDKKKPATVVEVGCGLDLLVSSARNVGLEARWIIVEPSADFAAAARAQTAGIGVEIIEAFFEATEIALQSVSGTIDLVILTGLLHEVDDPGAILARAYDILKPDGRIYVVVPNAASLHRRLAVAMGLIGALTTPSDRNLRLMQRRIFDRASLLALCNEQRFDVIEAGGMFLKPFTNDQMARCAAHVPPDVMTGLWRLGQEIPELASEIFVEAQKKRVAGPYVAVMSDEEPEK